MILAPPARCHPAQRHGSAARGTPSLPCRAALAVHQSPLAQRSLVGPGALRPKVCVGRGRRGHIVLASSHEGEGWDQSHEGEGGDWRLPRDKILGVDGLLSTQPDEVVLSALEAFRLGDIFAVLPVLRQPPEYSGAIEDYWSSEGPWGSMTTVARRVLPEHSSSTIKSCLSFGGRNLQRVEVTGPTGEMATLLWNLVYEEGRWQVASIGGEPDEAEDEDGYPSAPSPSLAPEKVVLAQLLALKTGNFGVVSRLSSSKLQGSFGAGGQFAATLRRGYRNLIWHARSRIIHQTQINADFVMVTVAVTAGGMEGSMPGRAPPETEVYTWLLSLQQSGPFEGCWLTDSLSRDPMPLEKLEGGEL